MIKVIYFSSSHRALPGLELLHKNLEIVGVVSQPDRPIGRKAAVTPTAISAYAAQNNIPLLKPEKLDNEAVAWVADKNPDVILLAYYGLLIPPELFNLTPAGILVTHPSLLPLWRWGSPVQATLLSGEKETGVTLMKMDEKLDHGPIVAVEHDKVLDTDDQESLYTRLFTKGAGLAIKVLPDYLAGKVIPQAQDHSKATFAKHITREDGFIPPEYLTAATQGETLQGSPWKVRWMLDSSKKSYCLVPNAECLEGFVRAMYPWPGAWTTVVLSTQNTVHRRLKIVKAHLEELPPNAQCLVPDLVQLEGKNPVSWKQFRQWQPQPLEELFGDE